MPADDTHCSFDELIVALACSINNVDLAVTAKREVGKLYEDVTRQPYIGMVNPGLTTTCTWKCLMVHRAVSTFLKNNSGKHNGRKRGMYVHANLFLKHMVFSVIQQDYRTADRKTFKIFIDDFVNQKLEAMIDKAFDFLEDKYSSSLLHQLFRNFTKTRSVKKHLEN
jgi:hypothetical protein